MRLTIFTIFITAIFACSSNTKVKDEDNLKLVLTDSSQKIFRVPESVVYFPADTILFVSNIDGKPAEADGKGFISIIKPNLKVVDIQWVTGLNAPKGMAILDNKLYVSDIVFVKVFDIETGKLEKSYFIENSAFLNDIAVNPKTKTIYITDTGTGKLFSIHNTKIQTILENDKLNQPNGLLFDNDTLFIGNNGFILAYCPQSGTSQKYLKTPSAVDGIKRITQNRWLISDWNGTIYLITPSGYKKIISTASEHINIADFEYIEELKKLYVPTFFDNRIMIYKVD